MRAAPRWKGGGTETNRIGSQRDRSYGSGPAASAREVAGIRSRQQGEEETRVAPHGRRVEAGFRVGEGDGVAAGERGRLGRGVGGKFHGVGHRKLGEGCGQVTQSPQGGNGMESVEWILFCTSMSASTGRVRR